jgi:hypothetical protein
VTQTARYLAWFDAELKKRKLRLVVLLLPNRYTIYGPLLTKKAGPWVGYLDRLDAELERHGIATLNGLEVYRSGAQHELETGELSFYREDTHWNPQGVHKIAAALAETLEAPSSDTLAHATRHVIQ